MSVDKPQTLEQLKRAIVLQRLRQRSGATGGIAATPAIAPAPRDTALPLSWAQQRLWFLDQLDPAASSAYHMPVSLRLIGTLDRAALRATLDRVVARHESLRTTFVSVDGAPTQVIAPDNSGFALIEEDLRALDVAVREDAVAAIGIDEAHAPFDLSAGPLIRGRLLRLAEAEHVLLVTQHHIVTDAWSIGLLIREVRALYAAFSRGEPDPLPPLPIQYADYAVWQRQWPREALDAQLAFWRDHLRGAPALLALPTDRPRPAVQSYAGARVPVRLPAPLTTALRALSQRHGTTMFMTLLAGWSALLSRLSGQDEVVVGTPVANRQRSQMEPLIGFFVNTLALRATLAGDPTVADLLKQIKTMTLEAYAHQDLPFEQVVEALQPARSLSHSPVFQAVLTLNNTQVGKRDAAVLPGLVLEQMGTPRHTAHFDLELVLAENGGAIEGNLAYATDLFDRATVERFAGYIVTLLQGMAADEICPVSALPILSPAEREQVLVTFNASERTYPCDRLIHHLFEAQARRSPQAIALTFEQKSLSYADLNQRANRIAHRLIELGVKPDSRVAICAARGLDLVAGLLGILKAGGGYVPLDPAYPAERLAYMLEDSAPVALLTQQALRDAMPAGACPVLLLDDDAAWSSRPDHDPEVEGLTASHLAYVIYTSGSTGRPKGVMIEHGHVTRLFASTQEWFDFDERDVWTLFHSFAFDFSVWEIWGALFYGGRLVIVPELCARAPSELYALLAREGVTVLNQTPSVFRSLIAAQAQSAAPHRLRTVIFGGEALELSMLAPWIERNDADRTRLINMYGITEITVHASYRRITETDVREPRGSLIGRALPDLQLYVLDARREPVPMGVTGELYVGGAGVARGYLNRDELTSERFVANPFGEGRLYKTGDLGRWLPDGGLEYLGRNDFQVKIRGYRIELGEIEAALSACDGVRDAVVIAREDAPGDARLVAYVVPHDGIALSASALRGQLSRTLAEYMLPGAFVSLPALPLTPNGKLDRHALPAPDQSAVMSREYEAPAGDTERAIAEVWQELLGLERVGRHDHFFELGGHSLLVIGLIERLRQRGLGTDVRTVFTTPTLSALAERVRGEAAASDIAPNRITPDTIAITPDLLPLIDLSQPHIDSIVSAVPGGVANIQDIYPLAPLQEGILFHYLLEHEGGGDAYLLRSVTAFDTRARLDTFLAALQAVIDRHDILRSAVHWQGLPRPVQVVQRRAPLPVIELTLSPDDAALPQLLARTDPRRMRLDLRRAPIVAAYITPDPVSGEWLLSLLSHHIVEDNYSTQLVFGEVDALLRGRGDRLPAAVPYRNFIARMKTVPEAEHEAYFRAQLGDVDEPTAPFGLLNVQGDGGQTRDIRVPLDDDLARRIRDHARARGVAPAVLFHLGWAQVLGACSGRDDVVFGTVLSGRLQGTEAAGRMVGMFINTLPVRLALAGHDVDGAIAEANARLGELLTHEQASLTLAQRCSAVAPPLPLFTSLFNYRHGHELADAGSAAADEAWAGIRVLSGEARNSYPLTMSVEDRGQGFSLGVRGIDGIDGERMLAYFATALRQLVDALSNDPATPMTRLSVLPPDERERIVLRFNATRADYPRERLVHQLFEAQARARPDADALICGNITLGYGELNRRANRIAHRLIALGVRPDDRVAICAPRGVAMVVGLLGVLKAGGAYVPLDPGAPAARLAGMLHDSEARALLTQDAALEIARTLAKSAPGLPLVVLDDESVSPSWPDHDPVVDGLEPSHLAYVIYTSGSTGRPKGVMVPHRGIVNYLAHAARTYLHADIEGAVVATPFGFDATVTTLMTPWLAGKPVVLLAEDARDSLAQLLACMRKPRPWLFKLTPAHLDALAQLATEPPASTRHVVVVGGEQLTRRGVTRFRERVLSGAIVINEYGPTETVVGCTIFVDGGREEARDGKPEAAARGAAPEGDAVPIGAPIANSRIYILDAHRRLAPLGVPGELYIGGDQVTRGYLGRPDLTRERFLPDPFADDSGARMYRSGDLARWRPDGNIEYLGRNDFQVKIRGFRIEPGEIEARLSTCDGVREAVVIAREDTPGDQRLVAYVVPRDGIELPASALRERLARDLADYMIPSAFVSLPALPLTPHGKLDRQALPAPDQTAVASRAYDAPVGAVEQTIAAIWQDLLGLKQVGRHDHFFELGGHSLLVIGLIERLRQEGLPADLRAVFAAPTLAALAERLAGAGAAAPAARERIAPNRIAAETRAITPDLLPLVELTQPQIDAIVSKVPDGAANIQDIYPLTPLQEGILFHHLLEAGGERDAYVMRSVLAFDSRARLQAFLTALQAVIDRHDILRSSVHGQGLPKPVQIVQRRAPLPVDDLTLSPQEAALPQLLAQTDPRRVRLDLHRAPILAARIAQDPATGEWLLALLRHHIVCDHVAIELILAEIRLLLRGQGDRLPAPLPYRDFIAHTRALPESAHEAYFRGLLGDVDDPTAPFGIVNVQGDGGEARESRIEFDDALARRIRDRAREHGVTPAVLFHVAWARVLAACSGRDDVVFGTVLSGRQESEGAGRIVGMFINTLPVRIRTAGVDALGAIRDTYAQLSELLTHEQASLALAQRCSAVPPPLPLFTTLLNYRYSLGAGAAEDASVAAWEGVRVVSSGDTRNNYPLTMSVEDRAQGFGLTALHVPGIDGVRLMRYLETAIAALVADARRPLRSLPVLPAAERETLLTTFNATATDDPQDRLIHALFEEQVRRQPDAPALACDGETLDYAELNRRANQVAHRLIALGVKPDDRVAICAERSLAMVIGLLGVLKAGGAYVPLDPGAPPARLAHMLADCAPAAMLTQSALRAAVRAAAPGLEEAAPRAGVPLPLLLLDDGSLDSQPTHDPSVDGLHARHLAYVIYTSGSTGRPKGVMIEHRSAVNFWRVMSRTTHRDCPPRARVALNAAFTFDMSLKGILQLLSGHCLVLIPEALRASGPALLAFLEDERIDAVDSTPSQVAGLLAAGLLDTTGRRPGAVLLGGEAIPRTMWAQLQAASHIHFFNMYGPTECTVDATIASMRETAATASGPALDGPATATGGSVNNGLASYGPTNDGPTIGRPVANTRVYVLDAQGEPAPTGVAGELYLGGVQVARGYWNRPDLTEARFLPDPFVSDPTAGAAVDSAADARMYKTGDLGRWRPDGTLEYLGRNDFQVKVRGYRIELGEVEAQLRACDGVRDAVVLAREDVPGDARLVAYVVPQDGVDLAAADLRDQLSRELADYMIPSAFVSLDALPLTPHGKLDRHVLPAPDQAAVASRAYEAPVGATEEAIAAIWQELLGRDRVGRHDHFFELGGHSLLAVQVATRVKDALGVELPLRDVFAQPTLQGLAEALAGAARTTASAIAPVDRREVLPLSWAQQRLWFLDQLDEAAGAAYHVPLALRLKGRLDRASLQATLNRVVARHESLRTTFVSVDGAPRQVIAADDGGVPLVEHDLSARAADTREAALDELRQREAHATFDLSNGPLIRGRLVRLGEDEHVLLVTLHHIVSDAWSIGVLIREVSALYTAFSRGERDPLPPLAIQYADYAVWQRGWLQGEALQAQLNFWRGDLSGAPALLELPTDRPRPAAQTYAGDRVPVRLPPDLTQGLRALSRRHDTTLFMTLLAGWSVLLSRLSGQDDVVIGTPVANRQRAEIEPLIGFFVNTLALRTRLDRDPTVAELLQQVKSTTLEAFAHQDLPFEQVVEALQPERSLAYSALFQAKLSLNNTPGGGLSLPGLELEQLGTPRHTAHFDLDLSLSDTGETLAGQSAYASDLFDRATVERMRDQWITVLRGMLADDSQRVSRLPLLSASERETVLTAFNATATDDPQDRLIHALFEEQVRRQPDAPALACDGETLDYAELNRRANQVAHRLIALGVKPDDRVAICAERSLAMVVGLLGVLKAGGAYVPLDPSAPPARLAHMLADCVPAAVLTQAALRAAVRAAAPGLEEAAPRGGVPLPLLLLDDGALASQPTHDPSVDGLHARHLAYVIYTSGSTGRPKGVMVEHRSAVNFWRVMRGTTHRDCPPRARVALNAAFTFDMSLKGILQLLSGHCLMLIPEAIRASGPALLAFLEQERIDAVDSTPSQVAGLLAAGLLETTGPRPGAVLLGGEAIPRTMWAQLQAAPHIHFFNMYGPTECTVDATIASVRETAATASGPTNDGPTIGRPVANTRVYVLDRNGEPAPIGVAGELYLAGVQVARGYWNHPELTEARFLPDPFVSATAAGDAADARMYKTGDLGRWRPDGTLEYLGRNDFQVKIRGYRIELGEIEAHLRACDGVRDAVVVAREDAPGDPRLVAYVVSHGGDLAAAELRDQLSRELADYMIPSAFVNLDVLPLTPHGKLDRRALPAPAQSAVASRAYEAPVGAIEETIAAIWQELLGLERVGRHDHFFELGGHSLMVIELIERLRQRGLDADVRTVFAAPALIALAARLGDAGADSAAWEVPANLIPDAFGESTKDADTETFSV